MKKSVFLLFAFVCSFVTTMQAQQGFLKPFDYVSGKKPSYITMNDGQELEGTIKKLKFKKGLIRELEFEQGEEVTEIPLEDIQYAYFPQSGFDKFAKGVEIASNVSKWNDDYDSERLKEGYAYFEKTEVQVKKDKMVLLMQLLNPGYCDRIKVYHDPLAGETGGMAVGGLAVSGGDEKSYYVRIDNGIAFKLTKGNYKKMFGELFGDCKKTMKKYEKAKWKEFEEAVFAYNGSCGNS